MVRLMSMLSNFHNLIWKFSLKIMLQSTTTQLKSHVLDKIVLRKKLPQLKKLNRLRIQTLVNAHVKRVQRRRPIKRFKSKRTRIPLTSQRKRPRLLHKLLLSHSRRQRMHKRSISLRPR